MKIYGSRFHYVLLVLLGLSMSTAAPFRRGMRHTHAQRDTSIKIKGDIDWDGPAHAAADTIPSFHVHFAGRHIQSDKGSGIFNFKVPEEDKQYLENLSLIICKRAGVKMEQGNTLGGITITKPNKCDWYRLEAKYDIKRGNYWNITKRQGQDAVKLGETIPPNAVVILMSSKYSVGLQDISPPKGAPAPIDGHIKLPRILLRSSTDSEVLAKTQRASLKSDIENIEFRRHTDDQTAQVREQGGVTIAL